MSELAAFAGAFCGAAAVALLFYWPKAQRLLAGAYATVRLRHETGVDPRTSPTGNKATGYAHFDVHVWMSPVLDEEGEVRGRCDECKIGAHPQTPLEFFDVAAQHLVRVVATTSPDGFEVAADRIMQGAMEGRRPPRIENP